LTEAFAVFFTVQGVALAAIFLVLLLPRRRAPRWPELPRASVRRGAAIWAVPGRASGSLFGLMRKRVAQPAPSVVMRDARLHPAERAGGERRGASAGGTLRARPGDRIAA
jgi:hypothetical protein